MAGASYESMMRWLGRANRAMAMAKVHVAYRPTANGHRGRLNSCGDVSLGNACTSG